MLSFWISIRTRNLRNLPFELSVWNYTLKSPKNITQLNTKSGFSVFLFTLNFILFNSFNMQILFPLNFFILQILSFKFLYKYVV